MLSLTACGVLSRRLSVFVTCACSRLPARARRVFGRGVALRSVPALVELVSLWIPDRAVSALLEYGRAVRASDAGLDSQQLRNGLQMHAHVIGVDPADLDEVLVDVLGQLFGEPQLQTVPDPSQPPE